MQKRFLEHQVQRIKMIKVRRTFHKHDFKNIWSLQKTLVKFVKTFPVSWVFILILLTLYTIIMDYVFMQVCLIAVTFCTLSLCIHQRFCACLCNVLINLMMLLPISVALSAPFHTFDHVYMQILLLRYTRNIHIFSLDLFISQQYIHMLLLSATSELQYCVCINNSQR